MNIFYFGLNTAVIRAIGVAFLCLSCLAPCFASFALDPTFGGGGRLTISFPDSSTNYGATAFRIFVQPSGRIVVGGSFTNASPDGQLSGIAFVGLTTGGALDSTFGSGGAVLDWRSDAGTFFNDALIYPDGTTLRISQVLRLPIGSSTVRTVRLAVNGAEDNVFASNVSIGPCCSGFFTARPVQIAVRSDGKILALIVDNGEYFLYRLNPDGTRDTTFGANGIVGIKFNKIQMPSNINMHMIALGDGKVLLAGHVPPVNFPNGSSEFFLARLTETGSWDKTFGRIGFLRAPFGPGMTGFIQNAVLQADGKILLCGSVFNSDTDTWMMRFRPNGRRDSSFGNDGVVINDFAPGDSDVANSIALSADGKIRMVGEVGPASNPNFLVARFSSSGTLEDNTSISFTPGQYAGAEDVTLQPDGKLLVAGYTKNPNASINGSVMAIARLTE